MRSVPTWHLSADEQMTLLGITSRSSYRMWRNEPPKRLTPDLLERLSYPFGIYKDLEVLLPESPGGGRVDRMPNTAPLFNGQPALDRLLSGHAADLYLVQK